MFGDRPADHPPTERVEETPRYILPVSVGCSVMSLTQSLFGPVTVKWRFTRSSDGTASDHDACTHGVGGDRRPRSQRCASGERRVCGDPDAGPEPELGVDPRCAVGATGLAMHLDDRV